MSDLHAYLTDLKLSTPEELSLAFVGQLQAAHIAKYSFNSLAVLLGEEVSLDLTNVYEKIVVHGLGGYCFEHNKLAFELLKSLGYSVRLVMARVLNGQEIDRPRTHRVTLVNIDGKAYLLDVGFGADCPISPLLLQSGLEQKIGHENYRIVEQGGEYDLQIERSGSFHTLYRFDLAEYTDEDCVIGNFFSSKYPKAAFVNNLVASIKDFNRTVGIRNHVLFTRQNGHEEERFICSAEDLHSTLLQVFNVDVEPVIAQHLFDRFVAPRLLALEGEAE
ncbi:arylamine N-acetyltransferase family protein [Marinomonas posidonica]|uniref:N-hydroxyarylamine O-acetyltransferase n=1 Tax=Marinomonas posidonica (strain CECT 7376 / NCIMB 14433 / IVIA-Po-181) TaxID=491952 RepID=F6CRZ6_MARPP|nr:arylamine N-acetyltransferase [Marinomonas posidonica]AEF56103.1 N-hydroxyarylamine O-acetyltransferase [Marinomonas posidonica IVIA-Po-181]